jgi:hypothetical protein
VPLANNVPCSPEGPSCVRHAKDLSNSSPEIASLTVRQGPYYILSGPVTPPPGLERITGFFSPIPSITLITQTYTAPTVEHVLPTPICPTLGNPPRQLAAVPGIEHLSPVNHNVKWCTRPLAVTQVHPGITMNLVPVADHPDADMYVGSVPPGHPRDCTP